MQTFVLYSIDITERFTKEWCAIMSAKKPYRTPEGDMCDLDPNKICDNCMKCVNKTGADYTEILADFDPESIRVFTPGEGDEEINEPIEPLDIDPELVAEWEEKLRAAEEAERNGEKVEMVEEELIEPIGFRGIRKKSEHISHIRHGHN